MPLRIRPGIMNIKPYIQGSSSVKGVKNIIKLSSNETPFGPSPKAIKAYKDFVPLLHRYNEGSCYELRKTIGKVHRISPEKIVCGAGSDELIALITQAYAGPGDEIIYTEHGFLMYPISAMRAGAVPVKANEKNLRTDINAILKKVNGKTKIVFIANPNNPTGSYVTRTELKELRKKLPGNVLLVIDSAYAEYVGKKDYTAGIDIVDDGDNTVMLRTFSKIYGLASLRMGWAYCPSSIADVLHRVRGPFNVSGPAQAAAIAAIEDKSFTEKNRRHNDKWVKTLTKEIEKIGFKVYPSVGNFILVGFGNKKKAGEVDAYLKKNGIIVRQMEAYGLPQCLRFSIGLDSENKKVLKVLKKFS